MMKDSKFARQVTTASADSTASTDLATDYVRSRQVSPESMNSAPMTANVLCTKQEVQINVMVEGLICADTSMDLHVTSDGASAKTGTEYENKTAEMYRGLVCGDSSMDVHLPGEDSFVSTCAPSEGLPTKAMFDGLVCADTSFDLHMPGADVGLDIVQDTVTCTPNQTKQGPPTEAMFEGLVCADTSMDLHVTSDNGNIEMSSPYDTKADIYWGLVCGDSSLDVHFDKEYSPLPTQTKQSLPAVEMFEGLVCGESTMDLHSTGDNGNIDNCFQSEQVHFAWWAAFVA